MRKKSQDELGTLLTREIRVMLQDQSLTKEQRFDILAAIMFDAPLKTPILASFAKSLKTGYDYANNKTFAATNSHRKAAKEYEQRKREELKRLKEIERNGGQLPSIDINGNQLTSIDGINKQINKQGISPYKPPKGGGRKVPKAVKPEDLFKSDSKRTTASGGPVLEYLCSCEADDPPQARQMAVAVAAELETREAFGRMRVNQRNLMRHLLPLAEKNSARLVDWWREVSHGLDAWTAAWKADDWQYAPGKITKWLADEKYLQPPRKKAAAPESVGSGCGDCGAEIA